MMIHEVMTPNVELISPDQTLVNAAKRMRERDIGALPVGEKNQLIGIITDRDIAVRSTADGRDPGTTTVQDVMTGEVVSSYEDQDIIEAAELMKSKKIRRVVVLNRKDEVAGILSLGDLVLGDNGIAGEVLERVVGDSPRQ